MNKETLERAKELEKSISEVKTKLTSFQAQFKDEKNKIYICDRRSDYTYAPPAQFQETVYRCMVHFYEERIFKLERELERL